MSDLKKLKIGDNVYKIEPFAPREAVPFGLKVAKVLAPILAGVAGSDSEKEIRIGRLIEGLQAADESKIQELMFQAFQRVWTPNNEPLSNEANFNAWFKDHKNEMFEAGFRSIMLLAEDFLPAGLKL